MKTRICISVIAAVFSCFAVTTHAAVMPQGDLNGNNTTDISDALRTLRIVVQLDVATTLDLFQADVAPLSNGFPAPDGQVDISDALLILRKVVQLVSWPLTDNPPARFAYVANNGSNDISVFSIDQTTGALTPGAPVAAGAAPVSVTVDPSGRFAYAANQGSDTISVYSIDQATGALTPGTAAAAGTFPVSVTVDPSGRFAYAANFGSDTISVYGIDQTTGALTPGIPAAAGVGPSAVTTTGVIQ